MNVQKILFYVSYSSLFFIKFCIVYRGTFRFGDYDYLDKWIFDSLNWIGKIPKIESFMGLNLMFSNGWERFTFEMFINIPNGFLVWFRNWGFWVLSLVMAQNFLHSSCHSNEPEKLLQNAINFCAEPNCNRTKFPSLTQH